MDAKKDGFPIIPGSSLSRITRYHPSDASGIVERIVRRGIADSYRSFTGFRNTQQIQTIDTAYIHNIDRNTKHNTH